MQGIEQWLMHRYQIPMEAATVAQLHEAVAAMAMSSIGDDWYRGRQARYFHEGVRAWRVGAVGRV